MPNLVSRILIVTFTQLLQNPSLSHLAHSFQDQRFTIRRILPLQQLFQNKPFHKFTPSHFYCIFYVLQSRFYYDFRVFNHTFIICNPLIKYNLNHKIIQIYSYHNHTLIPIKDIWSCQRWAHPIYLPLTGSAGFAIYQFFVTEYYTQQQLKRKARAVAKDFQP